MSYTPRTEEELVRDGLIPEGEFDFEVLEAKEGQSKKGNDMYTLKLNVFNADGSTRHVWDYLTMGNNYGERKLRHAASACGIIAVYESGKLRAEDFNGKSGKVQIKIQEGTTEYPNPKNVVLDYVKKEMASSSPEKLNDEIPF